MPLLGEQECQKRISSLSTSMTALKMELKTHQNPKYTSTRPEVMGQAAKDFGYTEQEFVKAVEMYQYFGNQNLEDVPIPNSQD